MATQTGSLDLKAIKYAYIKTVATAQPIYKRTNSNSAPTAPASKITVKTDQTTTGNWTLMHMPAICASNTAYKYLWTCNQFIAPDGTFLACSDVVADNGTTVIDGATIVTGTVLANAMNADSGQFNTALIPNLSADKITTGTINISRLPTDVQNGSKTATNYITQIDNNGIFISPASQSPTTSSSGNSVKINAEGMEVYKGSVSVAKYGDTARIGKESAGNGNVLTRSVSGSAGIDLRVGQTTVASLYQQPNYTPPEDAEVYNNAFVLSAVQYLALQANGKTVFESNGADSAAMRLSNSDFIMTDNFNAEQGGGRVDLELHGPTGADDGSTEYTTFINAFGGPEYDEDGTQSGVGIGVLTDDIEVHGVWDYLRDRWLIGTAGGSDSTFSGKICCPGINLNTTSGGANVRTLGANVSNYPDYGIAKYVSSSRRYKEDIDNLTDDNIDADRLYDLRVAQFRYKEDYLEYGDSRYGKLVPGFIAEEVEDVYPIAAQYENEMVEDWEPKFIIPPMLKLIQDQKKKIDELEERLEALERK